MVGWWHSKQAWRSSAKGGELLVLLRIAEAINDKAGKWSMSAEDIARDCKLSLRQVQRHIVALIERRDLTAHARGGVAGKNLYEFGPALLAAAVVPPPDVLRLSDELLARIAAARGDAPDVQGAAVTSSMTHANGDREQANTALIPHGYVTDDVTTAAAGTLDCVIHDVTLTSSMTHGYVTHDVRVTSPMTQPITINPQDLNPSAETEDMSKTKAQGIAATLRAAGVANARATSQLIEAAKLGAGQEDILAAIRACPEGVGDPFAYAVTVVLNRLRLTVPPTSKTPAPHAAWDDAPWQVVEASGVALGVGKWDRLREHWPQYKARVTAARAAV